MSRRTAVGIVAPSSVVPPVEFTLGVEELKSMGFSVYVHPQCGHRHLFFAGSDHARAQAFYDFAINGSFPVMWCARGGYGAIRIIPYLERFTAERGIPERKLLVGYSDATALLEYVRARWDWDALHAPMPGMREFARIAPKYKQSIKGLVKGTHAKLPFESQKLEFIGERPKKDIRAEIVGGNLAVWVSMVGTPYEAVARGKILFLEDVSENLYRIDRMFQQLVMSGGLEGVKGIVLGTYSHCEDNVPNVLMTVPNARTRRRVLKSPKPEELAPLRPKVPQRRAMEEIFGAVGHKLGIPVAWGLPVGHGSGHCPLPLGGKYQLSTQGKLSLLDWEWID